MAAEDAVFSTSDDASMIALLRALRSGAAEFTFVHRADVCAAAPEDLVADLQPAPGTDGACWYFYSPKKFKNAQGKASGHRQRAIGGGDTCWHAEGRPKQVVDGSSEGTACNLSYGRKEGRSFSRLGWCMVEYDVDDHHQQADAAGYVLCKVYRSPRASCSKSSSSKTAQPSSGSKRMAAGDEHPEARPAKLYHEQDKDTTSFRYDYAVPPCYEPRMIGDVGYGQQQQLHMEMLGGGEEEEPLTQHGDFVDTMPSDVQEWIGGTDEMFSGLEQQSSKQDNDFLQLFAVEAEATVEELLGQETTTSSGAPPAAVPPLSDADLFDGLEFFFGIPPEEQTVQMQQPRTEFVQTPHATAITCQQQQSQWMMQSSLLQGPRFTGFQLPCLIC